MRVLKFRAWDDQYKCMTDDVFVEGDGYIWESATTTYDTPNREIETRKFPVMQFTGLKDKNGVDIYEGDIATKSDDRFAKTGIVDFINGCWMVAKDDEHYFNLHHYAGELEVVGNVYESPELAE